MAYDGSCNRYSREKAQAPLKASRGFLQGPPPFQTAHVVATANRPHPSPSQVSKFSEFKHLIDEYNKGMDVNGFFAKLTDFVKELSAEEQRGVAEQLSEEELALFDIMTKPELDMTKAEKEEVKKVARMLLQTLKEAKLVLDWRKRQQTRADVYTTVKTILDELPRAYTPELYQQKCDTVYQHVFDSYPGEGRSLYSGT